MQDRHELRELTTSDGSTCQFRYVPLHFGPELSSDVFAKKNNKSLRETLAHLRYKSFTGETSLHDAAMDIPLGDFLLDLKRAHNPLYKRFLNKHGDKAYSTFWIDDPSVLSKKGIYAYFVGDDLRYIGRCRDTMKKRVNQGYGKIYPKNCYIDGQSTNCHLNAKITDVRSAVSLWFCSLYEDNEICIVEADLISRYRPEWNVQGL